jgi:hypothetical protein
VAGMVTDSEVNQIKVISVTADTGGQM